MILMIGTFGDNFCTIKEKHLRRNNMRYHFMHKMKDAQGEIIVQMMDFKGARLAKFKLSKLDQVDEELKRDTEAQMDRIEKSPFYTGEHTKNHKGCT
jgi:hypothetical protein